MKMLRNKSGLLMLLCAVSMAQGHKLAREVSWNELSKMVYSSDKFIGMSAEEKAQLVYRLGVIAPHTNETVWDYMLRLSCNAEGIGLDASDVDEGTITLSQPGNYYLTFDASNVNVVINVDNVCLDLKKHKVATIEIIGNRVPLTGKNNITITNGTIVGSGAADGIYVIAGSRYITLSNLRIQDVGGNGILIGDLSGALTTDITIENVEVFGVGFADSGEGIYGDGIKLRKVTHFTINNCRVSSAIGDYSTYGHGFLFDNCAYGVIRNSIARNNGVDGIALSGSSVVEVVDCISSFNGKDGIHLGVSSVCVNCTIINNTLEANTHVNLTVSNPEINSIVGNHAYAPSFTEVGTSGGANYSSNAIPRVVFDRTLLTTTLVAASVSSRWLNWSSYATVYFFEA